MFDKKDYAVVRILFVCWSAGHGPGANKIVDGVRAAGSDWMAQVYASKTGGPSVISYRFRYYSAVNPDPHQGGDEKVGETLQSPQPDPGGEAAIAVARNMIVRLIGMAGSTGIIILEEIDVIDGDVYAAIKDKPWCHSRPMQAGGPDAEA